MDENDFAIARRLRLESKLVQAALELLQFTDTTALMATIEGTTPPLLIVIGDADAIKALMNDEANS